MLGRVAYVVWGLLIGALLDCRLACGAEISDQNAAGDALIRALFEIPNDTTLSDALFEEAVLKLIPLGTTRADAAKKLEKLIAPTQIVPSEDGSFWERPDRNVRCSLSNLELEQITCIFFSRHTTAAIFKHYRDWDFTLMFGAMHRLQRVKVGSSSLEDSCIGSQDKECISKLEKECKATGGTWYGDTQGFANRWGCGRILTDKGRLCTDSSQCESICVAGERPIIGRAASPTSCHCLGNSKPPLGVVSVCTKEGIKEMAYDKSGGANRSSSLGHGRQSPNKSNERTRIRLHSFSAGCSCSRWCRAPRRMDRRARKLD